MDRQRALQRASPGRTLRSARTLTRVCFTRWNWTRSFGSQFVASSIDWSDPESRSAIRLALMTTHPDRGGDPADFAKVQQAKQILGL